jgi:hypothetical protein
MIGIFFEAASVPDNRVLVEKTYTSDAVCETAGLINDNVSTTSHSTLCILKYSQIALAAELCPSPVAHDKIKTLILACILYYRTNG